jgi:hypothetical protein
MTTRIVNVNRFPNGYNNSWGEELSELDPKWELPEVYALNLDAAWYWYTSGSYEGDGKILMYKDGKWDESSLSHCSCYGPTDGISFTGEYSSLDELEKGGTEDWYKEIGILVEAAREAGYK